MNVVVTFYNRNERFVIHDELRTRMLYKSGRFKDMDRAFVKLSKICLKKKYLITGSQYR